MLTHSLYIYIYIYIYIYKKHIRTHTQYLYNIALYTYRNIYVHICTHNESLHPLGSLSDYMPGASSGKCSDSLQSPQYKTVYVYTQ